MHVFCLGIENVTASVIYYIHLLRVENRHLANENKNWSFSNKMFHIIIIFVIPCGC